ncbi:MAG TPA: toprim domain-containing protein, partial [Acidobacteriota bacterium]|nr:toprim domain-containing protein [Acidobacteriota bacterium]
MEINQTKWNQFCADPATILNLESNIHSWIEEISGFAIPHLHQGKNKLGGRSEPGSPVIWYQSGHTPQGVPFVNATFSTFKNGGLTKTFDSKEALRALYEGHKSSQPAKAQKLRTFRITTEKEKIETDAKRAAENLACDLALWDSLPTEGTSGYLDRKAVGDVARGLDCIRYGAGFILVRIIDAAGVLRGFQKIFDDGSKRFTAGLKKKSSFVILGGSLAQSGPVYIVQGLATGLSIRKAIGASVICALDAFNLEPVVKSLRKAARGLKIIIAADNDHTKAQNLNPQTGLPIGNTGLRKAHRTALKYRCLVASPGFRPDDPGTDFNDLQQAYGLNAVRDDLDMASRPNPALAYQGERESQIARKAKAFSRCKLIRMESQYLSAESLRGAFERPDVKTIVAASPIGTGKTEAVAQLINGLDPNKRVLYISHLVSLNADAAARLGLEMYSDYKGHRADGECKLTDLPRVAVCLNSLPMLVDGGHVQPFEVVVLDEIEQLIRRLTTPIDHKRLVLDVLKYLIQHAQKLIVLDAHIGKLTLELLDQWRPDGGVILWNIHQPAT